MSIIPQLANREGEREHRVATQEHSDLRCCRRTGVTLEPRPLDKDGMEEITGIFSSPRKPSPLKTVMILDSVEEAGASAQAAWFLLPARWRLIAVL